MEMDMTAEERLSERAKDRAQRSRAETLVLFALAAAMIPTMAHAQEGRRWLVVPVAQGTPDARQEAIAVELEAWLGDHERVVLSGEAASRRLDLLGDAPQPFPSELRARLEDAARRLLEEVARGRTTTVVAEADSLLSEVRGHLDALGGDPVARRRVTDLGLFVVRARLAEHDEEAARAACRRLLSLLPRPEPDRDLHPPQPIALLADEAGRLTGDSPSARLDVELLDSSDRGCALLVNGQPVGNVPGQFPVVAGEYAVRLDCGGATDGRVHRVRAEGGPVRLRLAPALEQHAVTGDRLALAYASRSLLEPRRRDDAATIARSTGVSDLLLVVARPEGMRVEHLRVGADGVRTSGAVEVGDGPAREVAQAAMAGLAGAAPGPAPAGSGVADWAVPVGIGAIVAGLGVAIVPPAISAATAGCTERATTGGCVTGEAIDDLAVAGWIISGAVLATAGVVLLIVGATEGGGESVSARLGPGSLALEGRFR